MNYDKIISKSKESGIDIKKFMGCYTVICLDNKKEYEFYIIKSTYNYDLEYSRSTERIVGDRIARDAVYIEKGWESEANPALGIISDKSPMGERLLGKRKNDIIVVNQKRYLIIDTL